LCEPSFIRIILLTSIPVFLLRNCFPPQIRLPVASASTMHAATETAGRPAGGTPGRTATETAGCPAGDASAMHTSAEAGLAAEGVLVYHAAVVESAECAGALTGFHVRRDEPAIGAVVNRSAAKARAAIRKTMSRSTPKSRAMYFKHAVETGWHPWVEPVVPEASGCIVR